MVMIRQFANKFWQPAEVTLVLESLLVIFLNALQRSQKLFNAASSHDMTEEEKVGRSRRSHTAKQRAYLVLLDEGH